MSERELIDAAENEVAILGYGLVNDELKNVEALLEHLRSRPAPVEAWGTVDDETKVIVVDTSDKSIHDALRTRAVYDGVRIHELSQNVHSVRVEVREVGE